MTPIPLEEEYRNMTRKELENKLMEMPELEEEPRTNCCDAKFIAETDLCSDCKEHSEALEEEAAKISFKKYNEKFDTPFKEEEDELIHKRMNDINTFQACENEVYLRGTDEYGKDFQICFDSYNFLEWIDTEHLEYIKKQLVKHINSK